MLALKEIIRLTRREFFLEFRRQHAFFTLLLYAFATVFVVSLAFHEPLKPLPWITLYWIVMLFIAVQAAARSFAGEGEGQLLYLYQLASAEAVVSAKLIYNALLLLFMALASLGLFAFFLGNPLPDFPAFLGVVGLGAAGMASSLTLIAAISSAARQQAALMAVLSLPALFPQLMFVIRLSLKTLTDSVEPKDVFFSLAMTGVNVTLSLLLFPYLWRD